jgi:hypothetical protein
MAIAVSPPVALPPSDRGGGLRTVAMSLPLRSVGHRTLTDAPSEAGPGPDPLTVLALELAAYAPSWPGITQPSGRRWDLMAASDDFEAWVIAWPPGGAIELHDHGGSAGAVAVVVGELIETSIVSESSGRIALRTSTIESGGTLRFGGRHVHDIVNAGDTPAISVHVYAPRLTSMTYYRIIEGALEPGATFRYQFGEAVA